MEVERRNKYIENCKRKCACSNPNCANRRREQEDDEFGEQRTFVSFICETISVIAFIIFGSIVFWFAVGGVLFDFIKRFYYSDRYLKIVIGIVLSFILISMWIQCFIRTDVPYSKQNDLIKDTKPDSAAKKDKTQEPKHKDEPKLIEMAPPSSPPPPPPPPPPSPLPPPPDYMKISFKEKHLANLNGETPVKDISKKLFTLTISDEQKKEVFRTSKTVFVPELAMEKTKPALIFALKEILLEDY